MLVLLRGTCGPAYVLDSLQVSATKGLQRLPPQIDIANSNSAAILLSSEHVANTIFSHAPVDRIGTHQSVDLVFA